MKIAKSTRRMLDLFLMLAEKEITLKYKRTYLGFIWSLLNPLLTALVLLIAFKVFMRFEMKNYTLFILSAMFPWNWFSLSVIMATNSLTANASLIKKVIFPKQLLIFAIITGQLATLIFSFPILILLLIYYGKAPAWNWVYVIPVLIAIQFMATAGVAKALAVINAFFRDVEHITGVCLNMLFWMTPIIYPIESIPEKYRIIMLLNPMMYLIQSWRDVIMGNPINKGYLAIAFVTAALFYAAGTAVFNIMSKKIDEVL